MSQREIGNAKYRVSHTTPYGKAIKSIVAYTQNTEYHLQGRRVVAIRDRISGSWDLEHRLLGTLTNGSITRSVGEMRIEHFPQVGGRIWFVIDGEDVLTSEVICIRRPTDSEIQRYLQTFNAR